VVPPNWGTEFKEVCAMLDEPANPDPEVIADFGAEADWLANAEKSAVVESAVAADATATGAGGMKAALETVAPNATEGLDAGATPN